MHSVLPVACCVSLLQLSKHGAKTEEERVAMEAAAPELAAALKLLSEKAEL